MTSDELLSSVRRRARIPTASALGSNDADLLALANEELDSYLVPFVKELREDHGLVYEDQAFFADVAIQYRIPYRAIGNAAREVSLLSAEGDVSDLPRIGIDQLEGQRAGFYVQGDRVAIVDPASQAATYLRMWFFMRPNRLVPSASAAVVQTFDPTARTVELTSAPAAFAGRTEFDLVRARSPFSHHTWDAAGALVGTVITFTDDLPGDLAAGDFVCLPEQAPVIQAPVDVHPLLAQRVACKWLEANDPQALEAAMGVLKQMEGGAETLLSPRVDGAPQAVMPNPLWG